MPILDLIRRRNELYREHEATVVKMLLDRFDVPSKYKRQMLDRCYQRLGERFLTLDLFFELFPTFPTRLVLLYPFDMRKVMTEEVLFKKFGSSGLLEEYDAQYRGYVEPGEENRLPPRDRLLLGLPTFPPKPHNFGVVLHSGFEKRGGLVLHNHRVDADVRGTHLLWISETGQQLALESLDVVLDSLDNAAGSNGWVPEPGPAPEVAMDRGWKIEAEVETGAEAEIEAETADEYAVCA